MSPKSFALLRASSTDQLLLGPNSPSLMTMIPTIVATSVGAGWAPAHGAAGSRASVTDEYLERKIQFHPNTPDDDPLFVKWGGSKSRNPI